MIRLLLIFGILFAGGGAWAQSKMDLEDITIKGELHNDDRLRLMAREKNRMKNYVKFRTNYRAEIIQGLPRPEPRWDYDEKLMDR